MRPRGRYDSSQQLRPARARTRQGSRLGFVFVGLFVSGLLASALALTQLLSNDGQPLVLSRLLLPQAQAQGVTDTLAYPVPALTPMLDESDVLVRGAEAITETIEQPSAGARPRVILRHIVQPGDTIFGLALQYGLTPESVLWSNYLVLKDNPDLLALGQELVLPPLDGLIYVVELGDSVESIARRFKVEPQLIVQEPANQLANVDQVIAEGQLVFVPGGERELVVWQLPKAIEVRRTASGIRVYKVGVCGEVEIPSLGGGRFGFPTNRRYLSGYGFGPSHGGWDLAGRLGDPIFASDSGTVVYAGYSLDSRGRPRGYGQYVVLDHGNGYRTLYAHASQLYVGCGQQVRRGAVIAAVGSVGKSTGPHLHFEIRYGDNYANPAQFMALEQR